MPSVDEYLDRARERHGFSSDRAVSRTLGLAAASVNHWRTKRAWPSDAVMVRLADLAGVDPRQALMDLNAWRTDGTTRDIYAKLRETVLNIVLAGLIIVAASRGTSAEQFNQEQANTVYYGKWKKAVWLRWYARQFYCFFLNIIRLQFGSRREILAPCSRLAITC